MKKTLYLKFIFAYLIFGFFGFVMVSTFISRLTKDHLIKEQTSSLYQEATLIANTYATDLYKSEISLVTVQNQIETLDDFTEFSIWIINPSGIVILDSRSPINLEKTTVVENFDPMITASSYYTIGNFFDMFEDEKLSVFAPITSNYKVHGYVVIHSDMSTLIDRSNSLLNIYYITLALLFLLSLIILIFFTEIVYRPLTKITRATEEYASGNFHYKFQVDSQDEIGYLAASLSYMASEISKNEDNKKTLVANISHDFRSPLTSIKGYLEAMIDGTIPPEIFDKYLTITLNETERLTKLTNSLLTLNNLNTKGVILDRKNFDINAIIRSTVSSFEGTCVQKMVAIELILTGDSMMVNADLVKMQQVLYNLLDNAIKFSYDNSFIKIETTLKKNKLLISIKDSGIGIPKDSLSKIWDRFYKTDISRGKDKKGTGLGLSITKEIIQSHDEHINVISTEGVGTEFIFTLPLYIDSEDEDD